jgi:hypothetical protein
MFGTRAQGQARRRAIETAGAVWHKGEWMEAPQEPHTRPASFLLEQPAHATLEAHFHRSNQFQVFVEGSGSIGRHSIDAVTVHYAGAYTAYGPLIAGAQGLKYFTFRNAKEEGFIPVARREAMRAGPKRHAQSVAWDSTKAGAVHVLERHDLIAHGDDGLAAYVLRLPPDATSAIAPGGQAHLGQFYMVLAGELHSAGVTLNRWEHVYADQGEDAPKLQAGSAGAEVLCLQLPRLESVYVP